MEQRFNEKWMEILSRDVNPDATLSTAAKTTIDLRKLHQLSSKSNFPKEGKQKGKESSTTKKATRRMQGTERGKPAWEAPVKKTLERMTTANDTRQRREEAAKKKRWTKTARST
jgi:hypothetical protein